MLSRKKKAIIAAASATALVATVVPIATVFGMKAAAAKGTAAVAPPNQLKTGATTVDNTADKYVSKKILPTDLLEPPPSVLDNYRMPNVSEAYFLDKNDEAMSAEDFLALADLASFKAVWTISPILGAEGLPYTYTQLFIVNQPAVTAPADQTSGFTIPVDNIANPELPSDKINPPTALPGYEVTGTYRWVSSSGSVLNNTAFAALPEKAEFSAVWSFKRTDGRNNGYKYSQLFAISQAPVVIPESTISQDRTIVDNTVLTDYPSSLERPVAAAAGYKDSGTVEWQDANGAALSLAAYGALKDKAEFKAVWTFVRTDKRSGSYTYTQRFVISVKSVPVQVPSDQQSPSVTSVDNFLQPLLPSQLLVPPPAEKGYAIASGPVWQTTGGGALLQKDYASLADGTAFNAVWTLAEANGSHTYTYAQRFVVALAPYAIPDDIISIGTTYVDNQADRGALPVALLVPPTPLSGYKISGEVRWTSATGTTLSQPDYSLLVDKSPFGAVWTMIRVDGRTGDYTYTQQFAVRWTVQPVPENQTSADVTFVDNTTEKSLPADLLKPPVAEVGYFVPTSSSWRLENGTVLTDQAFVSLPDETAFVAVWRMTRADGQDGSYTYSQRFSILQPALPVPANQTSETVTVVDNVADANLPTALLVAPKAADGFELAGSYQWTSADTLPLTGSAYAALPDNAGFTAVWTFVRSNKKSGTYTYSQRFVVHQKKLTAPDNSVSANTIEVNNLLNPQLPSVDRPVPAEGYVISGGPAWKTEDGNTLTATAFAALASGVKFSAVWTLVQKDNGALGYTHTQLFVTKWIMPANQVSDDVTTIRIDDLVALPADKLVAPKAVAGFELKKDPAWQKADGQPMYLADFLVLPNAASFTAVWTITRLNGGAGTYTYSQRFVVQRDRPLPVAGENVVYPPQFPVVTDTRTIVYGAKELPNLAAPPVPAGYKPWSSPVFTNDLDGTAITADVLSTIPAGTVIAAKMTAAPLDKMVGDNAEFKIKYVVQKASVSVNQSALSAYGYGIFKQDASIDAGAALGTKDFSAFVPKSVLGYKAWDLNPVVQFRNTTDGSWQTIGDGTNGTIVPVDAAARFIAAINKTGGTHVLPGTTSVLSDFEYRYVWTTNLDDNHTGRTPSINYTYTFNVRGSYLFSPLNNTPVYALENTGYAPDVTLVSAFNGGRLSITRANLAEAINYRYPKTVDTTITSSPERLDIKLPPAELTAAGTMMSTVRGDLYTKTHSDQADKAAYNRYYLYKWGGGNMLLKDVKYDATMPALEGIVGRHVAFSSVPLAAITYEMTDPAAAISLAKSLRIDQAYFYAGFYYIPEDYENEQLDMSEIQKSLWDWQPSYYDPTGHLATDYKINKRVGNLQLPPVTGYDSNGDPQYKTDGFSINPPLANTMVLGSNAASITIDQLKGGIFTGLWGANSPELYTGNWDGDTKTHFNIGSYTYVVGNTLRSYVFAYFENLPLSNARPDVGFAYMLNDMQISII